MTHTRRFAPVGAAMLAAFLAVGCGGDGESGPDAAAESEARGAQSIDACAIVTVDDASAVFGQPAVRQEGQGIPIPMMVGECLWTWDTDSANQLLQFRIWNTEQAYSRPDDEYTEALDIGDRGHVRAHPVAGVDVEWVQDGRMVGLSYSKVGSDVPSPVTKVEAVKALARKVFDRL